MSSICLRHKGVAYSYQDIDRKVQKLADSLNSELPLTKNRLAINGGDEFCTVLLILTASKLGHSFVVSRALDSEAERYINYRVDLKCGTSTAIVNEVSKLNFFEQENSLFEEYSIYTSGSSGKPKLVSISNIGVNILCDNIRKIFKPHADDKIIQMSDPAFDAFIFEIIYTLSNGSTLVMRENKHVLPGSGLEELIRGEDIAHIISTPSLLGLLQLDGRTTLKCVCSVGEMFNLNLIPKFPESTRIFNLYGPTEATIWTTYYEVKNRNILSVPIGRPIDGVNLHLSPRKNGQLELTLSGKLIEQNRYLNAPNSGFYTENNIKYYKTGDSVTIDNNDDWFIKGRFDNQIKIRGYRIDLDEISEFIKSLGGVKEAIVFLNDKRYESASIVSLVMLDNDYNLSDSQLKSQLIAQGLPSHKCPNIIHLVDSIPITKNGKLDVSTSIEKHNEIIGRVDEFYTGDFKNKNVYSVWQEILDTKLICGDSNFFLLGGNSLLAARLTAKVCSILEKSLSIDLIYDHPVYSEFEARVIEIDTCHLNDNVNEAPSMSLAQVAIMSDIEENDPHLKYSIIECFELKNKNVPLIRNNFVCFLNGFDILSSKVVSKQGTFSFEMTRQQVGLTEISFSTEEGFRGFIRSHAEDAIDPFVELFKAYLLSFNGMLYIYWVAHHLIWDEHSSALAISKILSFTDYADKQVGSSSVVTIPNREIHRMNIRELYVNNPDSHSLKVFNNLVQCDFKGERCSRVFRDATLMSSIYASARDNSLSVFQILLLDFCSHLAMINGKRGFTIGIPVSTRSSDYEFGKIGMYVELVPYVYSDTYSSLYVSDTHTTQTTNILKQTYDSKSEWSRACGRQFHPEVIFSFSNETMPIDVCRINLKNRSTKYHLAFNLAINESDIVFDINYSDELSRHIDIEEFMNQFYKYLKFRHCSTKQLVF